MRKKDLNKYVLYMLFMYTVPTSREKYSALSDRKVRPTPRTQMYYPHLVLPALYYSQYPISPHPPPHALMPKYYTHFVGSDIYTLEN